MQYVFKKMMWGLLLIVLSVLLIAGTTLAAQVTLTPTADTDTQSDNAIGTNPSLNASQWCNIFVKFDLSSISGNVTSATFRMNHPTHSTNHTLNLCNASTDNWSEGGTKPSLGTQITSASVSSTGYKEFDVTAKIQTEVAGDKVVTFGLSTNLGSWEQYNARESANQPQLVILYDDVTATSTASPTSTSSVAAATPSVSVTPTATLTPSQTINPTSSGSPTPSPTPTVTITATVPVFQAIVELKFNENTGSNTVNTGTSGGSATLTATRPIWALNVPPGGGASSVDFGTTTGNYAVDLTSTVNSLKGLKSFTITGWVNCRSSSVGSGGNRVVSWINNGGDGVDLVYQSDGSLQVGIDQWPDGSPARSSAGKVPTDANAGAANWRFFAITYDPSLISGDVKFYFGTPTADATLDVSANYDRGDTGTNIGPALTIGHFNTATRSGATDRMFRGLIDQIRVYGSITGNSGALTLSQIVSLQKETNPDVTPTPTPTPTSTVTPTATQSPSPTISISPVATVTSTGSVTPTPTATVTVTPTVTPTPTVTITPTAVVGPTTVVAKKTGASLTIDGNLNETVWAIVKSVAKIISGTPNNTVIYGVLWDANYLYVGVKVVDGSLRNDSTNLWDDDSVEIYIDGNHNMGTSYDSYDRQIVKGWNDTGIWVNNSQTTGILHGWAAVTGGYSIEVAIPWSNLGVTATAGMTVGIDIGVNDDDDGSARDSQLMWVGTNDNWTNTSSFGDCYLSAEVVGGGTPTATVSPTATPTSSFPPTPTTTVTPTPTITPTGGLIGNNSDGTTYDAAGADYYNATRYQASSSMSVNQMKIKISTVATGRVKISTKLAIYSDNNGNPGSLLGYTEERTNLAPGWQVFRLYSPVNLTAGSYYWLVSWRISPYNIDSTTETATNWYAQMNYSVSWPTTLPAVQGKTDKKHCICAFYAPGASPAPSPTPQTNPVGYDMSFAPGTNIQRTMAKLAAGGSAVIVFYGQSISEQQWTNYLSTYINQRFPSARITYYNRARGGCSSDCLLQYVAGDIYPLNPDLVIFTVYGSHYAYEDIIRGIKSNTQAEIFINNDHYNAAGLGDTWHNFMSWIFEPLVAEFYQTGFVDLRTRWGNYLQQNNLSPRALLSDDVHLNDAGCHVYADILNSYFVYTGQ